MSETPNINELMKKAEEMQNKMKDIQAKIAAMTITGEAGAGLVKVKKTGQHKIPANGVYIDESILKDKEMIQDLIAAAINDATDKVEVGAKEMMSEITNDFKLPEDAGTN